MSCGDAAEHAEEVCLGREDGCLLSAMKDETNEQLAIETGITVWCERCDRGKK
jgi:hypothetical protein